MSTLPHVDEIIGLMTQGIDLAYLRYSVSARYARNPQSHEAPGGAGKTPGRIKEVARKECS